MCMFHLLYSMYPIAFSQHALKPTLAGPSAFLAPANTDVTSFGAVGTIFLTAGDRSGVTLWAQGPP